MKLYIIRHAEPDYVHDTITEKGKKEAALLGEYMKDKDIKAFYMSPMGRAMATCQATLDAMGREGEVREFLQEYMELRPGTTFPPKSWDDLLMHWDRMPLEWSSFEDAFNKDKWMDNPGYEGFEVRKHYEDVCGKFDELLLEHGYRREGYFYHPVEPNNDTIALYCHFGIGCVLLSHLLNISPVILWHSFGASPSSVTYLVTEEREEGTASWRMLEYGSTAHLAIGHEEVSFMGRFRECYTNDWERA